MWSPSLHDLLNQPRFYPSDLPRLLSVDVIPALPVLAQRALHDTRLRFGYTIDLFIPLYLSNYCYNRCTYCGFSLDNQYPRVRLTPDQILAEGHVLSQKGFRSVLLLTGEAPDVAGVDYIEQAVQLLRPLFPSIGIEVQPLGVADYGRLLEAGVDHVALYQETYDRDTYDRVHLSGKKKNYEYRLQAVEWAAQAGFPKLSVGILLGLSDFQTDAMALGAHLEQLRKRYWRTHFSVSVPRIKGQYQSFKEPYEVTDIQLKQMMVAFRLCFPDIGITVSTRESAHLRDELLNYGVTSMSAESNTSPGGYSGIQSEGQFDTSDHRSVQEIANMLLANGLDPVFKNWDERL